MADKKYDSIINLPYKKSARHPQMSIDSRAGQFGAFDVLTGFDEALDEAERQLTINDGTAMGMDDEFSDEGAAVVPGE